jgi:hypothetical protein
MTVPRRSALKETLGRLISGEHDAEHRGSAYPLGRRGEIVGFSVVGMRVCGALFSDRMWPLLSDHGTHRLI